MKKNKLLLIIFVVILIIGVVLGIYFFTRDLKTEVNELEVKYIDGDTISIKNPSSSYKETKEIVITNTSKDLKTYSLEWLKLSNTFIDQSSFLYSIKSEGERAASLDLSQVPSVESTIFTSVAIKAGDTHRYEVTITYKGDEVSNNSFIGTLKVNSKEVKKDVKLEDGIPFKDKNEKKEVDKKSKIVKDSSEA